MIRFGAALLSLCLAGCFFGHDHDHGHGGHGQEREPLPEQITAENAASVLEQSLRRVNGAAVGEGVVYRAWKKDVEGRPVVAGIEKQTTRSGPEGAWTRILIQNIRKIGITPPTQAGLGIWGITFDGETYFGTGENQQGMTATPLSIWSTDGPAVKALASSVERLRTVKGNP